MIKIKKINIKKSIIIFKLKNRILYISKQVFIIKIKIKNKKIKKLIKYF
jgi:hypothetical protein